MPDQHAYLSASSSPRWIMCPPSAKLNAGTDGKTSEYALQGTDAHSLAEYKLKKGLGQKVRNPVKKLKYFDNEMDQCTDDYAAFVLEKVEQEKETCPDPTVLVEQQLDLSRWIPESFGTADALIVADDTLTICDFKYGSGIKVDSSSSQLKCYALGALAMFDPLYDFKTVRMIIFQPRLDHISETEMAKDALLEWADEVLVPAAKLAFVGEGTFQAGPHCQFCAVKATCRKRAEMNLELAKYDFAMPPTLEDVEIDAILPVIDQLISWGNDLKSYALSQAMAGKHWEGFKLVEGRANRKYTNESQVVEAVKAAGFDPYEKKVLGITAMTSLLGKKRFEEVLGNLVERPQGKPTLVPIDDKRPEMSLAANDFKDE